MPRKRNILLITPLPELHHNTLLERHGYEVTVARSIAEARTVWLPGVFHLVLIVANGDLEAADKFCQELKQQSREQSVAILAGWNAYIPGNSCSDDIIRQNYSPESFLKQVSLLF